MNIGEKVTVFVNAGGETIMAEGVVVEFSPTTGIALVDVIHEGERRRVGVPAQPPEASPPPELPADADDFGPIIEPDEEETEEE